MLLVLAAIAAAAPAPQGWGATDAEWHLTIRDGQPVQVTAHYRLAAPDTRGGELTLAGPELLVTSVEGPVVATPVGLSVALGPDRTRAEQAFSGLYTPVSSGQFSLSVLPATRTRVTVDAPGLDVEIAGAVDGWVAPTDHLQVTWRPHVEGEVREQTVIQGETATTFRGDAGALAVDAVLRWRVVRGEARRFTFSAAGLDELDVAGTNIASWERTGGDVVIRTNGPVKGLFSVTVRGRVPLGSGERNAPTPEPTGVLRVDRYVTMARSDEGELIPISGPESVPVNRLPVWARNLTDAPSLAAWHGSAPVNILSGRFEAMQGPDTVVTAARYTAAAAREGRVALRMNLRVRNERRQYLRLRPPPGWTPVVVRVGNQPVSWLSDGEGGLYVPLEKSVETVKGLLSFPVDVEWIGTSAAWAKKGEQALTLPSVDAPVQSAAWEVHLPRGFAAGRLPSQGKDKFTVADLREGASVSAEELEEDRRQQEVVSSALQNAVGAYKKNDFAGAQKWLDEAHRADNQNEEVDLLQSNLDVISGKASGSESNSLAARRVKDLAKAKTGELAEKQQVIEQEAEKLYRSGDYDAAERTYAEALEVANELQKTEQAESVDQKVRIAQASSRLAEIRDSKEKAMEVVSTSSSTSTFERDGDGIVDLPDELGDHEVTVEKPGFDGKKISYKVVEELDLEEVSAEDEDAAGFEGEPPPEEPAKPVVVTEMEVTLGAIGTKGKGGGGFFGGAAGGPAPKPSPVPEAPPPAMASTPAASATPVPVERQRAAFAPMKEPPPEQAVAPAAPASRDEMPIGGDSFAPPPPPPPPPEAVVVQQPPTVYFGDAPAQDDANLPVAEPADPVTGTFSQNFNYDAVEQVAPESDGSEPHQAGENLDPTPTVTQEFLSRIPTGRSYQTVVAQTPGVVASGAPADPEMDRSYQEVATDKAGQAQSGNSYYGSGIKKAALAGHTGGLAKKKEEKADEGRLKSLGYLDEEKPAFDPYANASGWSSPSTRLPPELTRHPAPADPMLAPPRPPPPAPPPRPRPPPERRKPLVATPSPMALAMPLDGPAITTTQALLPADTFPTWSFRYREIPSENK